MNSWATAGVSILAAIITSGGIGYVLNALARRRTAPSEITAKLTAAAMTTVNELQEETASARSEARQARQAARDAADEVDVARKQVRKLTDEVDELTGRLHRLLDWVHDPYMTIDRLRAMVPLRPGTNGINPD